MDTDAKKFNTKQIAEMELEIQALLEETSYSVKRTRCRGKYRGKNDYTLVFGSGRSLNVSLGKKNYARCLFQHLVQLRYFRANQKENGERIKAALLQHGDRYADARVEIVPSDGTKYLIVYAAAVLTTQSGLQVVYRTTTLHYCLIGTSADWCSFDKCIAHLLTDAFGEMQYTRPLSAADTIPGALTN